MSLAAGPVPGCSKWYRLVTHLKRKESGFVWVTGKMRRRINWPVVCDLEFWDFDLSYEMLEREI